MKIKSIYLKCPNIEANYHFYHHTLGLKAEWLANGNLQIFTCNNSIIFELEKKSKAFYHFAFNIPHNQLEAAANWLLRCGIKLIELENQSFVADFDTWNAKAIYFYDPQGNICEFIARFDLPNQSDADFSPSAILTVSEIGWVVGDVVETVNELMAATHLKVFKKLNGNAQFVALGDNEGLLLVVAKNRPWFSDGRRAECFDTKVELEIKENSLELFIN